MTASKQMTFREKLRGWLGVLSPVREGKLKKNANGDFVESSIASPGISLGGHFLMAVAFSGAVVAYFVLSLISWLTAPERETFLQVPMNVLPTPDVQVTVECSNPPYCGDISLVVNYSAVTACSSLVADKSLSWSNASFGPHSLKLCYQSDFLFSVLDAGAPTTPGIFIDFSDINPGEDRSGGGTGPFPKESAFKAIATVTVTSGSDTQPEGYMKKVVIIDYNQVKTLLLARMITKKGSKEEIVSDSLLPSAVQYEGKRRTGRGTLFIRLESFATVRKLYRPGSLVEVLAGVGGAASLVTSILLVLGPILGLFVPGQLSPADGVEEAPKEDQEAIKAIAAGDVQEAGRGAKKSGPTTNTRV